MPIPRTQRNVASVIGEVQIVDDALDGLGAYAADFHKIVRSGERTRYGIARRYMIRLRRDDFEDPHELARFAAICGLGLEAFRNRFAYLVESEPPPLRLQPEAAAAA